MNNIPFMDLRDFGFDPRLISSLLDHIDFSDETDTKSHHAPSRAYVRDSKAMATTYADIIDYPNAYKFVVDMPGLNSNQINVQIEDNTLVVSGERKRDKDKEHKDGVKYIRMERRQGKFLKKFVLPENASCEDVCACYQDGVLTVTVQKKPPPEPKKATTIQVQVGGSSEKNQNESLAASVSVPSNALDEQESKG